MQLTDVHKVIFRFVKQEDVKSWPDLIEEGLGEFYSYNMRLIDIHRVVFGLYSVMLTEPRFEMGHCKLYDLLLTQVNDFDVMYGEKRSFTVEEIIEGQLDKMLMAIRLSRVDWIREQYA